MLIGKLHYRHERGNYKTFVQILRTRKTNINTQTELQGTRLMENGELSNH